MVRAPDRGIELAESADALIGVDMDEGPIDAFRNADGLEVDGGDFHGLETRRRCVLGTAAVAAEGAVFSFEYGP